MNSDELSAYHEGLNEMLDILDSYRAALDKRGYSPTAAEHMVMEYHAVLMDQVRRAGR